MRVHVIGSSSAYPTQDNPTSGYLIEGNEGEKLLLDIGSGVLMGLKRFMNTNDIDHIYISHMHADHSSDAGVACYERLVMKDLGIKSEDITFYTPYSEKAETLRGNIVFVDEATTLDLGSLRLTFLKTDHSENCHAIKVQEGGKSVVYTSDTRYFPALSTFAKGTDLLLAECTLEKRYDGTSYGHMNTVDVAHLASEARPKLLALVHTPSYVHPSSILSEVREGYDDALIYAKAGDTFDL